MAAHAAGLQRFLYHLEPDFGASKWLLISSRCGNKWDENHRGYWPTGTDKAEVYNGGSPIPDEI